MGVVFNIIDGIAKAVPVLAQKIITIFLIVFFLGILFGLFVLATKGAIAIAALALVLVVIYYKLDEGFLLLLLYFAWVFFF